MLRETRQLHERKCATRASSTCFSKARISRYSCTATCSSPLNNHFCPALLVGTLLLLPEKRNQLVGSLLGSSGWHIQVINSAASSVWHPCSCSFRSPLNQQELTSDTGTSSTATQTNKPSKQSWYHTKAYEDPKGSASCIQVRKIQTHGNM